MSWLRRPRFSLFVLALGLALASPAFTGVLPVSPGAAERLVEATSACPAFSWSGADGAVAYELAVLDLGDADNPALVFTQRIDGSGYSWTPSRDRCLAPGRTYAWLVRADVAGGGLGEWSAPRRFRVPGAPSIEEVDAALAVLERWRATQSGSLAGGGESAAGAGSARTAPGTGDRSVSEGEAPLATGVAAIRGEIPDSTGSAYGLFGITHSAAGAGVVARNETAGPDLVLDGAAQGEPDTVLTQGGLDRPSASGATFNFQNSGAGALTLQVDGVAVDTALTPIAWSRLASVPAGFADGVDNDTLFTAGNQLQLVGTQFNVLEGPGSGLEADTLDGLHAVAIQTRVTGVCPAGQPLRGIHADGSVVCDDVVPIEPTFTVLDGPAATVGFHASLVVGDDGLPVISYQDIDAGALKVAKCIDRKCSAATTATIDNPTNVVGFYTSIAIGADGLPVISYQDDTAGDLKVAKCNDPACAPGGETITIVDSTGDVGEYSSIAIGADGLPVIGYYDNTAKDLKVVKCNDAACAPGGETITFVDSTGVVGWDLSLAIGSDGFPVISYWDFTNKALKVAKCGNAACSSSTSATVDDHPTEALGTNTSIAIGADGLPVVAYQNDSTWELKVARCNDAACAGGDETITVVDSSLWEGEDISLAIGTDGYPVMAYVESDPDTSWWLKVAKCNDAACSGGDVTFTVVDPGPGVDEPSLAIGADGFPVIAYHEGSGTLRVAKCNNASCRY
jgi:hypothetical protein